MRSVAATVLVSMFATTALADIISISGSVGDSTEQTGATFSGTLDYSFTGGSSGVLIVSLTNDTPANVGGFLTGFVFNIDSSDVGAGASLSATSDADFLNTGNEAAPPFGNFAAGAALGADWTGGGSPNGGLGVGVSGMFTFAVSASDASVLTASSFINGPNVFDFVVRFRGLANGGSDKVPVPAPGVAAMLGLCGLATCRRRRG